MPGIKKNPPKLPTGKKAVARQTLRQTTRKALRNGMPVKASNKGLGITRNEGSAAVRRAIKTIGYAKAEEVVQREKRRTKKRGQ